MKFPNMSLYYFKVSKGTNSEFFMAVRIEIQKNVAIYDKDVRKFVFWYKISSKAL